MWIRSQDKTLLVDTRRILIVRNKIYNQVSSTKDFEDYDFLGEYETHERALEVLSCIEHCICTRRNTSYDMPKE